MIRRLNGQEIGKRIRKMRGSRPQKEVADAIGVSTMSISSYESGNRIPADPVKIRLAEYFGISLEKLFYE